MVEQGAGADLIDEFGAGFEQDRHGDGGRKALDSQHDLPIFFRHDVVPI